MSAAESDPAFVPLDDRLIDLVLRRATCGLSADEADQLQQLLVDADRREVRELEQSVAALRRGLDALEPHQADANESVEPMPEAIRAKILATAPCSAAPATIQTSVLRDQANDGFARRGELARLRRLASLGWLTAAAALVLAVGIWFARPGGAPVDSAGSVQILVDAAPDRVRLPFASKVPRYAGAAGEVVWSDQLQQGYMHLRGIAPNVAQVKQFQLWIVDSSRDERPVDGGVFDVVASTAADGEVIVPFTSRLVVKNPAAFAITEEKPGGVVVSAGPLLLVATR